MRQLEALLLLLERLLIRCCVILLGFFHDLVESLEAADDFDNTVDIIKEGGAFAIAGSLKMVKQEAAGYGIEVVKIFQLGTFDSR